MREDSRVTRTRSKLLHAFNHLVLERRKQDIRVADVVGHANVGRSTFYDHYPSAEALHMDALRGPLGPLADAAAGIGNPDALVHILAHFWEFRQRGRRTFGERTERLLASMVADRIDGTPLRLPAPIAARQLAAAAHAPLVAWLAGEASSTPTDLARSICQGGEALRTALRA